MNLRSTGTPGFTSANFPSRAMLDFDVLLINTCDVLQRGGRKYAIQFMNKFHATYQAYADLLVDLPASVNAGELVQAHLLDSFVLQQAVVTEPFFLNLSANLPVFERDYRQACEIILRRPDHVSVTDAAYMRAWAGHERLLAFMESILQGVSSRRTRALLTGLTGADAYCEPTLANTTAI